MTPITSLDIRPGPVRPDPLLVPLPGREHWSEHPRARAGSALGRRWRDVPGCGGRIAGRREWRRRIGHHLIAATAPAMRRQEPRRSRLWVWAVCAYLTLPAVAAMVGASLWLLRRIAT